MTDIERALAGEKNLRGATLTDAILTHADLTRANLYDADLYEATLTGADLGRADLSGVKYDAATVWPVGFTPPACAP